MDVWDKYNLAAEALGSSGDEPFALAIAKALGTWKLEECLDYIIRCYDIDIGEEDAEITNTDTPVDKDILAPKLLSFIKNYDYYEYADSLDLGETDEDALAQIKEMLASKGNCEHFISYITDAIAEEAINYNEARAQEPTSVDVIHYHKENIDKGQKLIAELESYETAVFGNKITVLEVKPMVHPRVIEINNELEALQKSVGGFVEAIYPFPDNVAVLVNEEGKLNGLELNRGLYAESSGELYDIIAGNFLVVGIAEGEFCSLTQAQIEKFEHYYHCPEVFIKEGEQVKVAFLQDDETVKEKTITQQVADKEAKTNAQNTKPTPSAQKDTPEKE